MIQTKTLILFTMLAGANASVMPRALSRNLITSAAEQVEDATTAWVRAVTKKNNPRLVADQFCSDGILWGTVSQTIRGGKNGGGNEVGGDIERYFDFFAKLPGITVKKANDNVAQITDDVYVNNANVKWNSDAFDAPVNARMTFIYRRDRAHTNGWCIFELHSSGMPDFNTDLKAVSGTARKLRGVFGNSFTRPIVSLVFNSP